MLITYIVIGIMFSGLALWTLSEATGKQLDEIQAAGAAIVVGMFWPIVLVFVILGSVFNIFAKIRQR